MTKDEILEEISKFSEDNPTDWPQPFEMDGFRLACTSMACPEQYDVFDLSGKQVGCLRLRHGHFRADVPDCGGETVYQSNTKGDGTFAEDERESELRKALLAINKNIQK
jgi:hypothetical protein